MRPNPIPSTTFSENSNLIQSNPIHGWIQSMSNSVPPQKVVGPTVALAVSAEYESAPVTGPHTINKRLTKRLHEPESDTGHFSDITMAAVFFTLLLLRMRVALKTTELFWSGFDVR